MKNEDDEMENETGVKDGVNPNAPDQLPSLDEQLKSAQDRLNLHRQKLSKAKIRHEQNMKKARELRELLINSEKQLANNEYEVLVNEEHQLMSVVGNLQALKTTRVSGGTR